MPYGEVWTRLAEYFRTSMRKVGIDVVLETTDPGGWARRIGDWDYETSTNFVSQNGDPTLGVERTYVSSDIKKVTFTNTGGYVESRGRRRCSTRRAFRPIRRCGKKRFPRCRRS